MREGEAIGQQQAEDAAGCADGGYSRAIFKMLYRELGERRRHHAHTVVNREALRSHQALDLRAEHVKREHVEQQVREAAVQEPVADQLPDLEAGIAVTVQRPEREAALQRHELLQHEHRDAGNQQIARNRRHWATALSDERECRLRSFSVEVALADADRLRRHFHQLVVGDELHRVLQRQLDGRRQQDGVVLPEARTLVSFLVLTGFTTRSFSREWMPMIMPSYSFSLWLTNSRPRSCSSTARRPRPRRSPC